MPPMGVCFEHFLERVALGFDCFAQTPANTVTSIRLPDEIDGETFVKTMRKRHGVTYAGGQAQLSGKIIRIAHLGWVTEQDVVIALAALERGLIETGYSISLGSSITAAQQTFLG